MNIPLLKVESIFIIVSLESVGVPVLGSTD